MPKYLIINPVIPLVSPLNSKLRSDAIIGTIITRSRVVAVKKAIKITGIDDPIVVDQASLIGSDLIALAKLAPILDSPNPVGRPSSGHRRSLTLTGLSDDEAKILDNAECKGAYVVRLIRKDLNERRGAIP